MTTLSNPQTATRSYSCRRSYQPYSPPWLWFAYFIFILVYFIFSIIIQDINLVGPVGWIDWFNARFQIPILPSPESPFIRLILNIFSPAAIFQIVVPILIANNLAKRTAVALMQNFYSMQPHEADSLLIRLQAAVGTGGTGSPGAARKSKGARPSRPGFPITIMLLIAPVLFFGMLALFAVIVTITRTQPSTYSDVYYFFLTVLLFVLWVLLIFLALLLVRDYQEQTISMSQRIPLFQGNLIFTYFLVFVALLFFPLFWMATIYLMLAVINIPPQIVILSIFFIFSVVLVTELVMIFILPRQSRPIRTSQNNNTPETDHINYSLVGPRTYVLPEGYRVAVTESNAHFCRVLGPGGHRLNAHEYVVDTLDLRQHEREGEKIYHTRDGIRVNVKVGVTFRLASNDLPPEAGVEEESVVTNVTARPTQNRLYPFGENAVRWAAYTKTVLDPKGRRVSDWQALPLIFTQSQLKKLIASLRYDELFDVGEDPEEPAAHPRLRRIVMENTQEILNRGKTGIHLIEVRLGPFQVIDDDVQQEHIETWRTGWEKQSQLRQLSGQTDAITERIIANQDGERVLINAIIQGINKAEEKIGSDVSKRIVRLRLIEAMERMGSISPSIKETALKELLKQIYEASDFNEL